MGCQELCIGSWKPAPQFWFKYLSSLLLSKQNGIQNNTKALVSWYSVIYETRVKLNGFKESEWREHPPHIFHAYE